MWPVSCDSTLKLRSSPSVRGGRVLLSGEGGEGFGARVTPDTLVQRRLAEDEVPARLRVQVAHRDAEVGHRITR